MKTIKRDYIARKGSRSDKQRYYLEKEEYDRTFNRIGIVLEGAEDENSDETIHEEASIIEAIAYDAATGYEGRGRNAIPYPRPDVASALVECMKCGTPYTKYRREHGCSVGTTTFYKCRRKWIYLLNTRYEIR